ncbi:hypothetical protein GRJ2_001486800 [Grus japonensis]|uniref:Glycerol kinase n=1 Tax=Grus japonensis TaxID=30415 RepID=A0ABC9WYV1_GRUJA
MDEELTKSLRVRIKGRAETGDTIAGVCYTALIRKTEQMRPSIDRSSLTFTSPGPHGGLQSTRISVGGTMQYGISKCVDDNFLFEVIEEQMMRGAMLELVLTNKEGLVGNVKLKGSLGCSDHEMMEFKILMAVRRAHSKLATLDFSRADYGLFRDLLGRVLWDKALEGRGAQDSWLVFKDHLLQAQERCMPTESKSGKKARRPT